MHKQWVVFLQANKNFKFVWYAWNGSELMDYKKYARVHPYD